MAPGREEYLAILPETDAMMAHGVADRIRTAVAGHRFDLAGGPYFTCSIGVVTVLGEAVDHDTLNGVTDRALYRATDGGRNRIELEGVTAIPGG
jgi:diguanylate cyclase (GGDEF)-like protein